jgi:hypothetical protein
LPADGRRRSGDEQDRGHTRGEPEAQLTVARYDRGRDAQVGVRLEDGAVDVEGPAHVAVEVDHARHQPGLAEIDALEVRSGLRHAGIQDRIDPAFANQDPGVIPNLFARLPDDEDLGGLECHRTALHERGFDSGCRGQRSTEGQRRDEERARDHARHLSRSEVPACGPRTAIRRSPRW